MRTLIQRVSKASVMVDGMTISSIDSGLLVFLGVEINDSKEDADWLAKKITHLRIFSDEDGKMNLSLDPKQQSILVISQFTLHASTKKGNRPSYIKAARPESAEQLYEYFCQIMEREYRTSVRKGIFGADMKVSLVNDGPVTIWMDSKNKE